MRKLREANDPRVVEDPPRFELPPFAGAGTDDKPERKQQKKNK
jgi:hypothetical protein